MKPLHVIIFILFLNTLASCSVEKRLYNKGYSISQFKKFRSSSADDTVNHPHTEQRHASQYNNQHISSIKQSVLLLEDSLKTLETPLIPKKEILNPVSTVRHQILSKAIKAKTLLSESKKETKNPLKLKRSRGAAALRLFVGAALCILLGISLIYNTGANNLGFLVGIILLSIGTILFIGAIIYVSLQNF